MDIFAISVWIKCNLLSLQPAKCCAMLLSWRCPHPESLYTLYVEGPLLPFVSSVKYLGVLISSNLSWSQHVSGICSKVRRLIGILYRRFYKNADQNTLLQLYKSFIRPHLEYSSVVWDPYLSRDISLLARSQKCA